jgi:hypothetical protein
MTQNSNECVIIVNKAMDFRFSWKAENLLTFKATIDF